MVNVNWKCCGRDFDSTKALADHVENTHLSNAPVNDAPVFEGISKREYFAALAMQNLQNVLMRKSNRDLLENYKLQAGTTSPMLTIARCAVAQADALIDALNNGQPMVRGVHYDEEKAP